MPGFSSPWDWPPAATSRTLEEPKRATATVRPRGISPAGPGRLPVDTARPPRLGRERGFREPDALGSARVGRLQARLGVGGG
jgi:hypothetical protein